MSIFGERRVCPRCGRKVRRPRRIEDHLCPRCGEPGPWATEQQAAAWQEQQDAKARAEAAGREAAARYRDLLGQIAAAGTWPR